MNLEIGSLVKYKHKVTNEIFIWFGVIIRNSFYETDYYIFHNVENLNNIVYIDQNHFQKIND
jgi:hypothetical protein